MNTELFRFINQTMKTPWLDQVIPFFSDKDYVVIPGAVAAALVLCFGRRHARTCLLALALALLVADVGSEKVIKNAFLNPRPYATLENVHLHRGNNWQLYDPAWYKHDKRQSNGFPSSHAANVAAIATALAFLDRRTLCATVPLALLVGFSRVYTGNHYPVDVLGGYGWGFLAGISMMWVSRRLVRRCCGSEQAVEGGGFAPPERQAFYWLLGLWTLANFLFVHMGVYSLAGDEAQYWDWSRRLALGYYSKPPMIAYVIDILTSAGGAKEWAIRSGAVIFSSTSLALIYALTLRIARSEKAALMAAGSAMAMPAVWAGSVLMTIDPLLVTFWTLAMYTFHRAVHGDRGMWALTGLAMGLGMLSKYTAGVLYVAFLLYLLFADRRRLRTPGPYVAMAISLLCLSGVAYWNWMHDWASWRHTVGIGADDSGLSLRSIERLGVYFGAQAGIVSPVLFGMYLWAIWRCLVRAKDNPNALYVTLCFGVLFAFYALVSLTHKPEPNWPVAAYPAAAIALGWVWTQRERGRAARWTFLAAVFLGCAVGVMARSLDAVYAFANSSNGTTDSSDRLELFGMRFAPRQDPTNELKGGPELRAALAKHIGIGGKDGAPFLFSDRYQMTAQLAFYGPGRPRAYCMNLGDRRRNQYDLWGGWDKLAGRDGLLVMGGDEMKARLYIEGLVQRGAFDRGEFLERVDVGGGAVRIKSFTISRLYNYSGREWTTGRERY